MRLAAAGEPLARAKGRPHSARTACSCADLHQLQPARRAALDGHRCLGTAEVPGDERHEFLICLAVHRRGLQLRQPEPVARLRERTRARLRLDLHLQRKHCHSDRPFRRGARRDERSGRTLGPACRSSDRSAPLRGRRVRGLEFVGLQIGSGEAALQRRRVAKILQGGPHKFPYDTSSWPVRSTSTDKSASRKASTNAALPRPTLIRRLAMLARTDAFRRRPVA
jgi:hypothetical protein